MLDQCLRLMAFFTYFILTMKTLDLIILLTKMDIILVIFHLLDSYNENIGSHHSSYQDALY